MHKDFVPPVSIEEFAAYLDGNLTEDGMNEVASAIQSDCFLQNVMSSCHIVDETVSAYEPLQLTVPEEISSTDFEIPQVDIDNTLLFYSQQMFDDAGFSNVLSQDYNDAFLSTSYDFNDEEVDHEELLDF